MGKKTLAVTAAALSATLAFGQGAGLDPELAGGIRLVDEGNFEPGIKALNAVAERLKASGDQPQQLSRAYLYLAIAHLQLSQEQAARARFVEAVRTDDKLTLSPYEFPPRVIDAFEEAKKGARPAAAPPRKKVPPTVFLGAVKTGDFATVRQILEEDRSLASARDEEFGATALHWAALRGHEAVAALLVAEGADLTARNKAGETPRDVALRSKRKDLAQILAPATGRPEGTFLDAVKNGDLERVRSLVATDPNLVNLRDTAFGATPLHWAALRGHVEVAGALLDRGADVTATNGDGETPLDVARRAKRKDLIDRLQGASRSPQARFFEAVREGDTGQVRRLLAENRALAKERDTAFGATGLHWAALRGHTEVIRLLLGAGADRSARNKSGETPTDVARRAKHQEALKALQP